ncbi:autoinducer binding domain-containing protein [Oceaniovalibus sp. ACAM 378]|jgi:LuxR family transcriptional regulator|uniref:autoinducer binding domain-containing protein n=1 Tax=Oceaniovalibus sp. ACAM 378 TaxID=2599923 RepID=UPI0011D30907|nr:autoinducer binding domain-containing protein [Oceaniovalibus sp. ACAM 378]TYB88496.1 LuxR family transcriptional regulator [Oceaniovalibus sp. ACAM 378]
MFVQRLFNQELRKLDDFAEAGYFLALHIRFTSPVMMFQTYDQAWIDYYHENGFVLRDPMTAWSFSTTGTTRWSNRRIPDPFGIFKKSREFGLKFGATISHGPIKSRTVCSIARSDREFEDDEIIKIAELVAVLHAMSDPHQRLTKAQSQALKCIADGMRHAAAADFLGISESALKLRLSSARDRLFARTTAEAIQRAKDNNIL